MENNKVKKLTLQLKNLEFNLKKLSESIKYIKEVMEKDINIEKKIFVYKKKSLYKKNHINNINLKLKNNSQLSFNQNLESKHFPSSVREWNNSIYLFNKNNLNLIPFTSFYAMKMIKSFFNLFNNNIDKLMRKKRISLRSRRATTNQIYLSKGEFKHSNNNVLINLYIFNRQKYNYLYKLKKDYLNKFLINNTVKIKILNFLKIVSKRGLDTIKEVNKNKYSLIKTLNIIELNKDYKINIFNLLSNYNLYFYKNLLNLTIRKLFLYFLYKQLIYINKSKLNYTYLRLLKKHMENLYNKNVEFNLINLKRFYLNSDILSETITLGLSYDKSQIYRILNRLKNKIKIHKKPFYAPLLSKNKSNEISNSIRLRKVILDDLKYKHVTGFRLETKGRLSRRFTASRSVFKVRYQGNLLNIDSSYRGLSSVILKGNLKSHMQYSKFNSKTKIGAFGVKGWVSGN